MAKIDLPYVQRFKDRHGRWRHYYRRKGSKAVALPGEAGSKEFMVAYEVALATLSPARSLHERQTDQRSVNAMIIAYLASAEFMGLSQSTKVNYRRILDKFRKDHGTKSAVRIEPHHLNAIFHGMADTPEAARNLRKRLMKAFAVAVDLGWRKDNPVRESKAKGTRNKVGHTPWSEADIETFKTCWPSGTRERLALCLLLYTGVRRSDVVLLGRQSIKAGRIRVVQEKTGVPIWLPVHPALQFEIDQHSIGMTFLLTQYGKPFTPGGFTNWFVARADLAGLKNRTPHGLRKAQGRRLAEANATSKEIAASLGHTSLREVETYTRSADQSRLADKAMEKLIEAETRTKAVKP